MSRWSAQQVVCGLQGLGQDAAPAPQSTGQGQQSAKIGGSKKHYSVKLVEGAIAAVSAAPGDTGKSEGLESKHKLLHRYGQHLMESSVCHWQTEVVAQAEAAAVLCVSSALP